VNAELVAADAGIDLVCIHSGSDDVAVRDVSARKHLSGAITDAHGLHDLAAHTVPHKLGRAQLQRVAVLLSRGLVKLLAHRADLQHAHFVAAQVLAPEELELVGEHKIKKLVVDRSEQGCEVSEQRVLCVVDRRVREIECEFGLGHVRWAPHRAVVSVARAARPIRHAGGRDDRDLAGVVAVHHGDHRLAIALRPHREEDLLGVDGREGGERATHFF